MTKNFEKNQEFDSRLTPKNADNIYRGQRKQLNTSKDLAKAALIQKQKIQKSKSDTLDSTRKCFVYQIK